MMNKKGKGKKGPKLGIMVMVSDTPMGKAYKNAEKKVKRGKRK